MNHLPTQSEIKAMLAEAGVRPHRRWGQHFLIDGNLMRMLVEAADLAPHDTVLEVGAAVGNLTGLLLIGAGHVVAVEVDPRLAAIARDRLADAENLDLLVTDVLADKHRVAPAVLETVVRRRAELGGPVKLVSNLPYQAATPLVAELVRADPPPERLVFTVQKEVADRLVAAPDTSDYGPASVLVQALAEVAVVRRLGPSVFWPRPRVWSAMVCIRPSAAKRRQVTDLAVLRRTIDGLFGHRRKRAARSLALVDPSGASPRQWAERLADAGLDAQVRGEAYSVAEIVRLANALARQGTD
ncbi:MAG TPA: 16S rRNA (adenine(1518)-N(6)/adenine(1519)-N(6))-dimethyltransferase RsmA [Phycisphaerae bacterium]|nr:16S rRNA (adenine(1518)-N(6)/adenine(1519)-N(6))-dimethyltransferase RsmA [Phycisphaerae bacterium]